MQISRRTFFLPSSLTAVLLATSLCSILIVQPALAEGSFSFQGNDTYAAGMEALKEGRWGDAVARFDDVAKAHGKMADASFYWKAYSLKKLGKTQEAGATCVRLHHDYSQSTWNKDCKALGLSIEPSQVTPAGSADPSGDPELRIMALNSLLSREPAQAVRGLRDLLSGTKSLAVRQHVLFVIAQSESPEAEALMHDCIVGKMGLDVQRVAIQASGAYLGTSGNHALQEVYQTSTNPQVKETIISSFFISDDEVRLVALARAEKDIQLKRYIVSQLSLMSGKASRDYMTELLK